MAQPLPRQNNPLVSGKATNTAARRRVSVKHLLFSLTYVNISQAK